MSRAGIFQTIMLWGVLFIGVAATGWATKPVHKQRNLTPLDKPIFVSAEHPTVTLRLESNPTTGYMWYFDAAHSSRDIMPMSHSFTAPASKLIGAPGVVTFTFAVRRPAFRVPQLLRITLLHGRPSDVTQSDAHDIVLITHS